MVPGQREALQNGYDTDWEMYCDMGLMRMLEETMKPVRPSSDVRHDHRSPSLCSPVTYNVCAATTVQDNHLASTEAAACALYSAAVACTGTADSKVGQTLSSFILQICHQLASEFIELCTNDDVSANMPDRRSAESRAELALRALEKGTSFQSCALQSSAPRRFW